MEFGNAENPRVERRARKSNRKPLQEISHDQSCNISNQSYNLKSKTSSSLKTKSSFFTAVKCASDPKPESPPKSIKPDTKNENDVFATRDNSFFQSPLIVGGHFLRSPNTITNIYRRSPSSSPESEKRHGEGCSPPANRPGSDDRPSKLQKQSPDTKVASSPGNESSMKMKTTPPKRRRGNAGVSPTSTPPGGSSALLPPPKAAKGKSLGCTDKKLAEGESLQAAVDHWKERALNAEKHLKTLVRDSPPRKRKDSPSKDEIYWNQKYEELLDEKKGLESNLEHAIQKIEKMKRKRRASTRSFVEMVTVREEEWQQKYMALVDTKNTLAEIVKEMQSVWEWRYISIQEELQRLQQEGRKSEK